MVLIIIEGADGVGKTTATNVIKEITGWKIKKFSMPKSKEDAMLEYVSFLITDAAKDNYILDRSWWGEFVYGELLRGYSPDYFDLINGIIKNTKVKTFNLLIIASPETIRKFGFLTEENKKMFKLTEEVNFRFNQVFTKIDSGDKAQINQDLLNSKKQFEQAVKRVVGNWLKEQEIIDVFAEDD